MKSRVRKHAVVLVDVELAGDMGRRRSAQDIRPTRGLELDSSVRIADDSTCDLATAAARDSATTDSQSASGTAGTSWASTSVGGSRLPDEGSERDCACECECRSEHRFSSVRSNPGPHAFSSVQDPARAATLAVSLRSGARVAEVGARAEIGRRGGRRFEEFQHLADGAIELRVAVVPRIGG